MIYLFDANQELIGTVQRDHVLSLEFERELNGLYFVQGSVPVSFTDKDGTINYYDRISKATYIGHYDITDKFYMHRLVLIDVEDNTVIIKGAHLFFDEAKAFGIIKEQKYIDREISYVAPFLFEPIGWKLRNYDTSAEITMSFYEKSLLEARTMLIEEYGFEFDFHIAFDGQKIRGKYYDLKKRIGKDTTRKYTYGENVLKIKVEEDFSEIYTAVIPLGADIDAINERVRKEKLEAQKEAVRKKNDAMKKKYEAEKKAYETARKKQIAAYEAAVASWRKNREVLLAQRKAGKKVTIPKKPAYPKATGKPTAPKYIKMPVDPREDPSTSKKPVITEKTREDYTRRVDITNKTWRKANGDPMDKPKGQRYLEDVAATKIYGYRDPKGNMIPKTKVIEFGDDIESSAKLLELGYEWLMANNHPKAVFEVEVYEPYGLLLGDTVHVVYRDIDTVVETRVFKVVEDLVINKRRVEFGDGELNQDNRIKTLSADVKETKKKTESKLAQLKREFDEQFEAEYASRLEEIEIAKHEAEILADALREEISAEVDAAQEDFTTQFEDMVEIAESKAQKEYEEWKAYIEDRLAEAKRRTDDAIEKLVGDDLEVLNTLIQDTITDLNTDLNEVKVFAETEGKAALEEAKAYFASLKIGGRNLILDSKNLAWQSPYDGKGTTTKLADGTFKITPASDKTVHSFGYLPPSQLAEPLEGGATYTFSITVYSTVADTIKLSLGANNTVSAGDATVDISFANNERKRISVTWTVPSGTTTLKPLLITNKTGAYIMYNEPKLERGTVATDWTPASEDADQRISKVQADIIRTEGLISSKVSKSELDLVTGNVAALSTRVDQTAESYGILASNVSDHGTQLSNLKVETDKITGIVSDVSAANERISKVEQTASGISQTVSDMKENQTSIITQEAGKIALQVVSKELSNVTAGGANLIRNALDLRMTASFAGRGVVSKVADQTTYPQGWLVDPDDDKTIMIQFQESHLSEKVKPNTEYIFSVTLHPSSNDKVTFSIYNCGVSAMPSVDVTGGVAARYVFKFKTGAITGYPIFAIQFGKISGWAIYSYPQLEVGSIPTSFSRSQSDYLMHTDFYMTNDGFVLGTSKVGGKEFASAIVGSATGIALIGDNIDISNNLTVQNTLTAKTIEALNGKFGTLDAKVLKAGTITGDHIATNTISGSHLKFDSAFIDKFTSREIYANFLEAKRLKVGDLEAAEIHALLGKYSYLESQTGWFGNIFAEKLTTDDLLVKQLKASVLTVKDINALDITTARLTAVYPGNSSRYTKIDPYGAYFKGGSVTIETSSGRKVIINGKLNRSQTVVPRMPELSSGSVSIVGDWYTTDSTSYVVAHTEHVVHEARYLAAAVAVNQWSYPYAVDVYATVGTAQIASNYHSSYGLGSGTHYGWIVADLGEPLDVPSSKTVQYHMKTRNSASRGRMHLANRFLTDDPPTG